MYMTEGPTWSRGVDISIPKQFVGLKKKLELASFHNSDFIDWNSLYIILFT